MPRHRKTKNVRLPVRAGVLRRATAIISVVAVSNMQIAPAFAQVVPDGRTATSVTTAGGVTDVTTGTIVNGNAFNSFETLNVRQLETVNLHQPGATGALINVVRGGQTTVEGTLNALKDGKVGGNVFIVNPSGLVVSQGGVINAGALTVSTPTAGFADRLIGAAGTVDQGAVSQLFAGNEPLSADGNIEVYGEINARRLELRAGARMIVEGRMTAVDADGNVTADPAVNSDGNAEAAGVSVEGGVIRLFAEGDVSVSGSVSARRSDAGGDITVRSGSDISVSGDVSADGLASGNAGDVLIFADGSAILEESARVSASAMAGDGGFVEFSAKDTVTLIGELSASSQTGSGGVIVIDPVNLNVTTNQYTDGADLFLQADEKITIANNVVVSTRRVAGGAGADQSAANSTGDSGDLLLMAKDIEMQSGSAIYAQGGNGHNGGLVMMLAAAERDDIVAPIDSAKINASIVINNATIHAGAVSLFSIALAENKINAFTTALSQGMVDAVEIASDDQGAPTIESAADWAQGASKALFDQTAESLSRLVPVQVQRLSANSKIEITDSTIRADGTFDGSGVPILTDPLFGFDTNGLLTTTVPGDLYSDTGLIIKRWTVAGQAIEIAGDWDPVNDGVYIHSHAGTSIDINPGLAFVFGTAVGIQETDTRVKISNSDITAVNRDVSLISTAKENTLISLNPGKVPGIDGVVGVTVSVKELKNQLLVDGGSVNAGGDLSAIAMTGKEHAFTGTANAGQSGKLAISVLVSTGDSITEAALSGDLDAVGKIDLDAETIYFAKTSVVNATLGVGSPLVAVARAKGAQIFDKLKSFSSVLNGLGSGTENDPDKKAKSGFAGGTAIDVSLDDDDTFATLGGRYHDLDNDEALVQLGTTTADTTAGEVTVDSNFRFASAAQGGRGLSRDVQAKAGKLTLILKKQLQLISAVDPTINEGLLIGDQGHVLFLNGSVASMRGDTVAEIGAAATVNAASVEVNAKTAYDLNPAEQFVGGVELLQTQWRDFTQSVSDLQTVEEVDDLDQNDNFVPDPIDNFPNAPVMLDVINPLSYLTTFTAAKGNLPNAPADPDDNRKDQELAVGVTFNYFNTSNRTEAVVRNGASITTTDAAGVELDATTSGLFVHMVNKPTAATPGGSPGSNDGVGAGITVARNISDVFATIESGATINANALSVKARNEKLQLSGVFAGGSAAKTAINMGVGVNIVENQTKARISDGALVNITGAATVEATDTMDAWAVSGTVTRSQHIGVGASGAVNFVERDTRASLSAEDPDGTLSGTAGQNRFSSDGLTLQATNDGLAIAGTIAGAIVQGKKEVDAPTSTDTNDENNSTPTHMLSSGQSDKLAQTARDTENPDQGTQKSGFAFSAAASINFVDQTTFAGISTNALVDIDGALDLDATNNSLAVTVAGAVSASFDKTKNNNALAGSLALTDDTRNTRAFIRGAKIDAEGALTIDAHDTSTVVGVAVGGAGTAKGNVSIAGSVAIGLMSGSTVAEGEDTEIEAESISVKASDTSVNTEIAGGVSVNMSKTSGFGAGVGVSISTFSRDTIARLSGASSLKTSSALFQARSDIRIYGFGIAGGAGKTGVAGAVTVNTISGGAKAIVNLSGANPTIEATSLTIDADETNEIWSLAGALALGRSAAVGGAVGTNTVSTASEASLQGATVTGQTGPTAVGLGAVEVTADTTSTVQSIAVAGGAAKDSIGVGVGISVNVLDADILAQITNSSVTDAASILSRSTSDRTIRSLGGAVAAATRGAAGFASTVNIMTGTETATSLDGSTLTTRDNGAITGIVKSEGEIASIAAAVSLSKNLAIGGSATVNVSDAKTMLSADGATLTADGALALSAEDDIVIRSLAGTVSGGGKAAIGAAVSANVIGHTTSASADNARLTGNGVRIEADNNGEIETLAAALAAAPNAGVAGSVTVNDIGNVTRARAINTRFDAGPGALSVSAVKSTSIKSIAGAVGASGSVAVGAAVAVNVIHDTVTADVTSIGDVTAGSFSILADNSASIETLSAAGAAGGSTAVAGSLVYNQIGVAGAGDATTQATNGSTAADDPVANAQSDTEDGRDRAFADVRATTLDAVTEGGGDSSTVAFDLTSADITRATLTIVPEASAAPELDAGAVSIVARDRSTIRALAGGAAGGGSGGFGAAFSINTLFGSTQAELVLPGATVTSNGSVEVKADQEGLVETLAAALGVGGSAGGAGSVTVNVMNRDVAAKLGAADEEAKLVANSSNVTVTGRQKGTIGSIAGSAAGSGGPAFGGAVGVNVMADDQAVTVQNVDIDATGANVRITATQEEDIDGTAFAGSVGATGAFAGALAINSNSSDVKTLVNDAAIDARDINVDTLARVTMDARSIAVAADGGASASLGVATNVSRMTVSTDIDRAVLEASNNISLTTTVRSSLGGIGVSGAASGGVGITGSAVANSTKNIVSTRVRNTSDTLETYFGGSSVIAGGTAVVGAQAVTEIGLSAGDDTDQKGGGTGEPALNVQLSGGGAAGIGASVAVNETDNVVTTEITDLSRVVGLGAGAGLASPDKGAVRGAAIYALADTDVDMVSVNAAVGGTVGVAGLFSFNVISDDATVQIGDGSDTGAASINATLENLRGRDTDVPATGVPVLPPDPNTTGTEIDSVAFANAAQQTLIYSAADTSVETFGAAVGIGPGAAGVGAVAATTLVESQAKTNVETAQVGGVSNISLLADTSADLTAWYAGVGGGFVGGAATVGVNDLAAQARIKVTGADVTAGGLQSNVADPLRPITVNGSVTIAANSTASTDTLTGAIGAGAVGVSGAIQVNSFKSVGRVDIDDDIDGDATNVRGDSGTTITAGTTNTVNAKAAGGAVGGFALALTVNVNKVASEAVVNVGSGQALTSREGTLRIAATETSRIGVISGAIGGGAIGVGASVDYLRFTGKTRVDIGSATSLAGGVMVDIDATANRDVTSAVVVGQIGAVAAASVAVSVIEMGAAADRSDAQDSLDSTQSELGNDQTTGRTTAERDRKDSVQGLTEVAGGNDARDRAVTKRQAISVTDANADDVGVSIGQDASISSGYLAADGSTRLGGTVDIDSVASVEVDQFGGTLAAGGVAAGIASGTTVANVGTQSTITVGSGAAITGDTLVSLNAETRPGASGKTIDQTAATVAVSGGIAVGVGVAKAEVSSLAKVTLGAGSQIRGTVSDDADVVSITATRSDAIENRTANLGVGLAALGTVVTRAVNSGRASVGIGAVGQGARMDARNVTLSALDRTRTITSGLSGTGGIIAGSGVDVKGTNLGTTSVVADNTVIDATGTVILRALSQARSKATAQGVTVGVGAIGVSLAEARTASTVTTRVGTGSDVTGRSVIVDAAFTDNSGAVSAEATANSASGGALAGNGVETEAYVDYNVQTLVDANITGTSSLDIRSRTSGLLARATGDGKVGGLAAIGAVSARAGTSRTASLSSLSSAESLTRTTLSGGTIMGGTLNIDSIGGATYQVSVDSGSGGVVSGSSSVARTIARGRSEVLAGTGSTLNIMGNRVSVEAENDARMLSKINNLNASLVGASGAAAVSDYSSAVQTQVAGGTTISGVFIDVGAANSVSRTTPGGDWAIRSGSGGALDVAAMKTVVRARGDTRLNIADGAAIRQVGNPDFPGTYRIGISNSFALRDRQVLDSGGAIAVPKGESLVEVASNPSVLSIGDADLTSLGDMELYNGTDVDLFAEVDSTSYGLAGAASGDTDARYSGTNLINVADGAFLESLRDINFGAGRRSDGAQNVKVRAETRLFNKTAIPIPTPPNADAFANTASVITIAAGADIRAVEDVRLDAVGGGRDIVGYGRGKDLWQKTAEEIGNFFGGLVGAEPISLDLKAGSSTDVANQNGVVVNGTVRAGSRNKQYLLIGSDNTQKFEGEATEERGQDIDFAIIPNVSVSSKIQERIDELNSFISNPNLGGADPAAKLAWEIERDRLIVQRDAAGTSTTTVVAVQDIKAVEGNVAVLGDYLRGSGVINAPGDAKISIVVQSNAYLETNRLSIPVNGGGVVSFNDIPISSEADAAALSMGGPLPSSLTIIDGSTSDDPVIELFTAGVTGGDIIMLGDVDNFRGLVQARSEFGNMDVRGDISAKTIRLEVPNGDYTQGFTFGITNVGGDPDSQYAANFVSFENSLWPTIDALRFAPASQVTRNSELALAPTESVISAGKNVYISAETLNINGLIQAGRGEYTVDIAAGIDGYISTNFNSSQTGRTLLHNSSPRAEVQNAFITGDVLVYYDHDDQRIEIDPMIVQGGRVELLGDIISTGNGRIEALDGFGNLTINSAAQTTIAVGRMDVGSGLDGSNPPAGIEGVVRIIDTNPNRMVQENGTGPMTFLTTEYRRLGNEMKVLNNLTTEVVDDFERVGPGGAPSQKTVLTNEVSTSTANGGRTATYNPLAGRDFVTVRAREITTTIDYDYNVLVIIGIDGVDREVTQTATRTETNAIDLGVAPYVSSTDGTIGSSSGTIGYGFKGQQYFRSVSDSDKEFIRSTVKWWKLGSGWEYYEYTRTITRRQIYEHRLQADKPIDIFFSGADSGQINVTAVGNVVFTGIVENSVGQTNVTSTGGSILTGALDVSLNTAQTNLRALGGSIDGVEGAFRLNQDPGATITLEAFDNINVREMSGDMNVASATATNLLADPDAATSGNVRLTAEGSILQAGSGAVTGVNVELIAEGKSASVSGEAGRLGEAGTPFRVDTRGGRLAATARGSIVIEETSGDLGVQNVTSQLGDVTLIANDGSITDRNDVEVRDIRTDAELVELWTNEMALNGSGAAARLDEQRQSLINRRLVEYNEYWDAREAANGAAQTFVLDSATETSLRNGGWTDAQVTAYVADRNAAYTLWNGDAARIDNYVYVPTTAELNALLEGGEWSLDELRSSIRVGLVRPTTDTVINVEDANISAFGSISLQARDSVGELVDPLVLADGTSLSGASQASVLRALAGAERSDVLFRLADGTLLTGVEYEAFRTGGGDTTGAQIEIRQLDDIDVAFTGLTPDGAALGDLTIKTTDAEIFLGAEQAVDLREVAGPADVQIKIDGDLTDVAAGSDVAVTGSVIVLEAGNTGGIGTATNPLDVDVLTGGSLEARAGEDIYLRSSDTGDVPVAGIFAGGNVELSSAGAIIDSIGQDLPRIIGNGITVTGARIGAVGTPLGFGLSDGATGSLSMTSTTGDLFAKIHATDPDLALLDEAPLTSFVSAGGGSLESEGRVLLTGNNTIQFGTTSSLGLRFADGLDTEGSTGTDVAGNLVFFESGGTVGTTDKRLRTNIAALTFGSLGNAATPLFLDETDDLLLFAATQNGNATSDTDIVAGGTILAGDMTSNARSRLEAGGDILAATIVSAETELLAQGSIGQGGTLPPIVNTGPLASPPALLGTGVTVTTGLLEARTTDGDIRLTVLDRATDVETISAGGTGSIVLTSTNAPLTLLAGQGGIMTAGGDITADLTSLFALDDITSQGGDIALISGPLGQAAGTTIDADSGRIDLFVDGDFNLASVSTTNGGPDALLIGVTGLMTADNLGAPNLVANTPGAGTTLALGGLAPAGPLGLITSVATLTATVGTGDAHINETDDLILTQISAPAGNVDVLAGGQMQVGSVTGNQNVVLMALGDLRSDAAAISGDTVHLFSNGGAIAGLNGSYFLAETDDAATLRMAARNDIFYQEQSGDLVGDFVLSDAGRVDLRTPGSLDFDTIGAASSVIIAADDEVRLNHIGGEGQIDIADEVALQLVRPELYGPRSVRSPELVDITARNTGSLIEVQELGVRRVLGLHADNINANVVDPDAGTPLQLTLDDSTGDMTELVDLRVRTEGEVEITRGRIGTGQVATTGPRLSSPDVIVNGDVFFRRGEFDLLAQVDFRGLSTEVDAQILAFTDTAFTFSLDGPETVQTTTLVLNRKREGTQVNGGQGFTGGVGVETVLVQTEDDLVTDLPVIIDLLAPTPCDAASDDEQRSNCSSSFVVQPEFEELAEALAN